MEEESTRTQRKPLARAVMNIGAIMLGMAVIYFGFIAFLGTGTPFFVVSSGSMVPTLEVGDIIVVSGNTDFGNLIKDDIIVFDEPGRGSKVIVHRIHEIFDDSIRSAVTKGDHNVAPDSWRVTSEDYLGKVIFSIPKVGYLTTALVPPMNYIVIVIVIATIFMLELRSNKDDEEKTLET